MKGTGNIIFRLMTFAAMFIMASCVMVELDEPSEIGEGVSDVRFDVEFRPLGSSDPATRTAGDAVKDITSICVVVYNTDSTLFNSYTIDSYEGSYRNSSEISDHSVDFAEAQYRRASFSLSLPLGKYRIYAVANYTPSEVEIASENALKSIQFTWNEVVAQNNAMFGYFTNDNESVPNYSGNNPEARFEAPVVYINKSNINLHAWVRRIVSKVTVGFDGSELNENVFIYIHSVQVKDIPTVAYLGKDNKPADRIEEDGETIFYRNSSSTVATDGLRVTKGVPTGISNGVIQNNSDEVGGVHHEAANALFLFENLQGNTSTSKGKWQDSLGADDGNGNVIGDGAIDYPDGGTFGNIDYKDGVKFGSYIEVKGYYVNKTSTNASQGSIVYRFMLGKDTEQNCDVERSNHYKVTLRFKNDANDVDWHIGYVPENPEISIPTPLYISYGYNEVLNVPVVLRGASINSATPIKATITSNPWGYPEHPYYSTSNLSGAENGFLSFLNQDNVVTDKNRAAWLKKGAKYVEGVTPESTDVNVAYYTVPVYTRPLILGDSMTGHNPYVSQQRKAVVKFEATVDGKQVSQEVEVIQVKRLVNPTGVWRSANNDAKFNIRLMELNVDDVNDDGMVNTDFYAPVSDGPWTAHIEKGSDWVRIASTGSNDWGTEDVTGATGSEIRFDYKPEGVNGTGTVRCGVIRVTYHNNNCVHYVFVSQGVGIVNLGTANWQTRNVRIRGELVANPLLEGSMFKFGNPHDAVLVDNNYRDGYGFNINCHDKNFYINNTSTQKTFESVSCDMDGFVGNNLVFPSNTSIRPPSYAEWTELETMHRRYGVMYGDECSETMTTTEDAYSYWKVGQKRGMQGMFVWDESKADGSHIFFPIGSTGYGHRKVNDNAYKDYYGPLDKYSLLKYAQRPMDMPDATAKAVPMYYDIWRSKGGIYWYNVKATNTVDNDGVTGDGYAHDINFYTMLFQTYGKNPVNQADGNNNISTDAMYLRCVVNLN